MQSSWQRLLKKAYGQQWDDDRIAPLTDKKAGNYYLELFHGPTLAFKDVALQCLPRLMKTALENSDDHRGIVILTATSGDTVTAAMRGFQSCQNPGHRLLPLPRGGPDPAQADAERKQRQHRGCSG